MLEICNAISIIGFGAPPKAQNSLSHRSGGSTRLRACLGPARLAAASHQEVIIWLSFLSFSLSYWLLCLFSGLQKDGCFPLVKSLEPDEVTVLQVLGTPTLWAHFAPLGSIAPVHPTLLLSQSPPHSGAVNWHLSHSPYDILPLFFSNFLFFATLCGSEVVWIIKRGYLRRSRGRKGARKQKKKWIIGFKINLYFFMRKLFLFSGKITWARHGNYVWWLRGCKIQNLISVGLLRFPLWGSSHRYRGPNQKLVEGSYSPKIPDVSARQHIMGQIDFTLGKLEIFQSYVCRAS